MSRCLRLFVLVMFAAAAPRLALADDEAESTPAAKLLVNCLLLVHAESSFPPTSSQQLLAAHQTRLRTICWDWRALASSASPERPQKGQALLERCLHEAPFDLARAHELYYERHVKSIEQLCRDFGALVGRSE